MYIDIKYLNLLSSRLDKFKQTKRNVWNFRCPICGDSQRNKNKARGYVYETKGNLIFKCHNCGTSMNVDRLINKIDPVLHKEYRLEKFQDGKKPKPDMRKVKRIISEKPHFKKDILKDLIPISKLNNSHPAKEYLLNRKLPTEALYYTEKFKEWTNSVKPDTFQDVTQDEGRIIIPFKSEEGDVFGFQGRSLNNTSVRYLTILLQEGMPKVFGLDKIDYAKPIFITEGPFDSLFLENAIAMAGADVSNLHTAGHYIYILDNEPRNGAITARIKKLIDSGENVVIWPSHIRQKDINDMILAGLSVENIVKSNIYSGLNATLKFNEWKK